MNITELRVGLIIVHNNPYSWEGQKEIINLNKNTVTVKYVNCTYPDLNGTTTEIIYPAIEEDYRVYDSIG